MHQGQKEAPAKQVFSFVDVLLTESESNTKCYDVCETDGFWKCNADYYISDEQGSIRYLLSQDGAVQNTYQYDAFGERLLTEESIPNRLRYNAQIEDELTGLYYLRARYFNPTTGRFTQEDVIYNDGLNLYAYCNSNPVTYCDPSGYECELKSGGECCDTTKSYVTDRDIEKYRNELGNPLKDGKPMDTVAVAKTNIPGLENQTFKGASPNVRKEAGLADLDEVYPDRTIVAPYDYKENPRETLI